MNNKSFEKIMQSGKRAGAAVTLVMLFAVVSVASWPAYFNQTAAERWSKADRVVKTLALRKGQTVADLGAGGGYFSVLLAREVGSQGTVYAVDISRRSLNYIKRYAKQHNVSNIKTVLAAADNPHLKKKSIDLVFTRNTYHHINNRVAYFRRLKQTLKRGGRVAVIDYLPRVYSSHSTPEKKIVSEMKAAGYRRVKRCTFLSRQSFNIFAAD